MALFLPSLIIICCILLVLIILIQNPKGGGLSSSFGGGGTQIFGGVKKTTDFLDKGTWVLSAALLALVLGMNVMTGSASEDGVQEEQSEITQEAFEAPAAAPAPQQIQQIPAEELPEPVKEEEGN